MRRSLDIETVVNEEWKTAGNGHSVLTAKDILTEPFLLLMADHLVDEHLLAARRWCMNRNAAASPHSHDLHQAPIA